jgi:glycogen phosphorylase
VGDQLRIRARVHLGHLTPGEVSVELYLGRLNADGQFTDETSIAMNPVDHQNGLHIYQVEGVPCRRSGRNGYTVRARPLHVDEAQDFLPGYMCWADELTLKR